jgi:nucleotide-binding universal stress UspA family protein
MFKRILVPIDGSGTSLDALMAALQLAREGGGCIRIVQLLDPLTYLTGFEAGATAMQDARDYAMRTTVDAMELARDAEVPADCRILDKPGSRLAEVVADEAREFDADLIAVGTHGRRGIGRVLLGSDAEQVIRLAPVPVLAVRTPQAPS